MQILVTGGAGYIGSHTCVELLAAGHEVVVVDNLDNSSPVSVARVQEIAGTSLEFYELDLRAEDALDAVFQAHDIDAVVHFAGLKAVAESVERALDYYDTNIGSTLQLLKTMQRHEVRRLVFSSSATVYGDPSEIPITEQAEVRQPESPYGTSKLMIEQILRDVAKSDPAWRFCILRYFNPVGAHESGRIGEDPQGFPNNLMPFVMQVAIGRRSLLQVFGDDYPTRDGTAIRDYIHVVDLARAHVAATNDTATRDGVSTFNLGTGVGSTVLEIVSAASNAVGFEIPYEIVGRRAGDVAEVYADPTYAAAELGWRAERGIQQMVSDHWRWQEQNPGGFD